MLEDKKTGSQQKESSFISNKQKILGLSAYARLLK